MVTVMSREGVVVVTTCDQAPKAMAVDVDVVQWEAKWIANLTEVHEKLAYKCWCFLGIEYWRVVLAVVTQDAVLRPFIVRRNESDELQIEFEQPFISFLAAPPADISTRPESVSDSSNLTVRFDVMSIQVPTESR